MVPPSQATPGYLSSLFLVPKKGGVQRPVVNLKPLNQFLPYEHFKMEGIHMVKYLSKKRRFHGQDRSQRCIFNSPPLSGTSKVCEVQLGGHPLQVCLPSLWSVHCPSSIYQNHETSCSSVKAAGHQIDHLFGRLAHHGPVERNAELSCFNDSSPFREFRFYDQLSQVSSNPSHNNGIFRLSHRLPGNNPSFAEGQSQKGKERMSKCSKSPSGYGERAGQTIRPLDLYHSSCLSRPLPLPPLARRQKQSPCSSGFIRLPGSAFSPGIRGADMVEGQFRCMEWEEPHIRISGSHNRTRCIPQGLGGLLHGGCYGRAVVPRRISATHQLSRAPSRSLCNKDLCKIQSSNESSPTDGQQFCGPLHQQNGENKITSPSSSSHRSMGMVLTTQNLSRGPVSPWGLKHKGRQGVQGHVRSSRLEIRPVSICKVKSVVGAP